jgi:hypothetical protein
MSTDIDDVVIAQEQCEQLNDLLVQLFDAPATDLASIDEKEFPCWLRGFAAGYNAGLKRGAAEEREANGPVGPGTVQFSTTDSLVPPSRREMTAAEAKRLVDQSERAQKNRNFEYDPLLT